MGTISSIAYVEASHSVQLANCVLHFIYSTLFTQRVENYKLSPSLRQVTVCNDVGKCKHYYGPLAKLN